MYGCIIKRDLLERDKGCSVMSASEDLKKEVAKRLDETDDPLVLRGILKYLDEGHQLQPLQEQGVDQSDPSRRTTQFVTKEGGLPTPQKVFDGLVASQLEAGPVSHDQKIEHGDPSIVRENDSDPSTTEDREREANGASVVSQPEAGEVLPEEASENGYPPAGESGEVENYASVAVSQPEAGSLNETKDNGDPSAVEGGERESFDPDEEGEPDATSQPCSPTTANAASEFVISSHTSTAPLTSHTSGVATAHPTQGAQPYDSGVPSPSSLEAQGFSEDDPPGVLGPETTKPVAVGKSGGGLTVVVYPSKDKPVQEENGGEDELRRRIAELEKDSSDKDAKCEQLSAQFRRHIIDDSLCANCAYRAVVRESSEKRVGYALLLFNSFKGGVGGLKELEWAESEAKYLEIVLRTVGYEVRLVRDSNKETMMKELRDIKKHFKEGDRHVLVFISTHGRSRKDSRPIKKDGRPINKGAIIYDNDGGKIYELDETLYDISKGVKKPILACVDTCRGEETLTADELPSVCIFYSSMPGYSAHEEHGYGSPFVSAICGELLQGYRCDSLYTILCHASGRVRRAELYDCDASGARVWQVPEMRSTICQAVYLSDEAEKVNSIQRRSSI